MPKYGIQVQHWYPIIVPLLIRKLDGESIRLWTLERNQREIAKLQPLLDFICKRADGMDAEFALGVGKASHCYTSTQNVSHQRPSIISNRENFRGPAESNRTQTITSGGTYIKKRRGKCYHCGGQHQLFDCQSFDRMTIELREERLRNIGVCTKCLRRGHDYVSCTISNCKICWQPHKRLLCPKL